MTKRQARYLQKQNERLKAELSKYGESSVTTHKCSKSDNACIITCGVMAEKKGNICRVQKNEIVGDYFITLETGHKNWFKDCEFERLPKQ